MRSGFTASTTPRVNVYCVLSCIWRAKNNEDSLFLDHTVIVFFFLSFNILTAAPCPCFTKFLDHINLRIISFFLCIWKIFLTFPEMHLKQKCLGGKFSFLYFLQKKQTRISFLNIKNFTFLVHFCNKILSGINLETFVFVKDTDLTSIT